MPKAEQYSLCLNSSYLVTGTNRRPFDRLWTRLRSMGPRCQTAVAVKEMKTQQRTLIQEFMLQHQLPLTFGPAHSTML